MGLNKLRDRKSKKEQVVETPQMNNSHVYGATEREVYSGVVEEPNKEVYRDYEAYGNVEDVRPYQPVTPVNPGYGNYSENIDYGRDQHNEYAPQDYVQRSMEPRMEPRSVEHRPMESRPVDYGMMGSVSPREIDHRMSVQRMGSMGSMSTMPQDPRNREMVVDRRAQETSLDPRFHRGGMEVADRRYHPVSSMEISRMSEFSYSNPDKYGLQILDVRSSDKVKLLKPRALGVEPLVISNIVDRDGKVAEKLYKYMDRYGITVLPLRECGVFEGITSIEGFKIVEIKGKKFASYCGDAYPSNYVDNLIRVIADRISSAQPYGIVEDEETMGGYRWNKEESRLSRFVTINGKEVEIPSLCNSEIEYICAVLANYNCNIVEVTDDFAHIIVGIDLAGMGFGEQEN